MENPILNKIQTRISQSEYLSILIDREKGNIRSILVLGIAMNVLLIGIPVGVQVFVNHLTWAIYQQPTLIIVVLILGIFIITSVIRLTQSLLVERLQRRIFKNTAMDFANRLTHVKLDHSLETRPSELVNRFFEVVSLQKSSAQLLVDGFSLALQTLFGILLIAIYHWTLLIYAILLGSSIYFILISMSKNTFALAKLESDKKYGLVAWLEEIAVCSGLFRNDTNREFALNKTKENLWGYLQARENYFQCLHKQNTALSWLQAIASAALLAFGGLLVIKNHLSVGQLVAAELIVTAILLNIVKFHKHIEAFFTSVVAEYKISHALDFPLEKQGEHTPEDTGAHTWEFINVKVERQAQFNKFFKKINLKIKSKERVCALASRGMGKSSFLHMIYGSKNPDSGNILVDGVDIRSVKISALRDRIGFAKDIDIIPGTLLENLRLGRQNIAEAEVMSVIELVGLKERVLQLEDGLNNFLQVSGHPLSSAQARQLIVARALLNSPGTLIIDGILDSLDIKTASMIVRNLIDSDNVGTFLLGTSDDRLAALFDKIIDLNVGNT